MRNVSSVKYQNHKVFKELDELKDFYKSLSYSISFWLTTGVSFINIDSRMMSSMQGTLESISDVLQKGRINDSYTLLRKLYDLVVINIYSNLYLEEEVDLENFSNNKITDWIKGKEKIPSFGIMSGDIIKSDKVNEITKLIYKNGQFKGSIFEYIRQRCNEHTHYLYFNNLLSNDNEIYLNDRIEKLNEFSSDLNDIFILHFSYLFYVKQNYMMSSDYMDYRDLGQEPPDKSEYWVAPFIQKVFNNTIKKNRPDIAKLIMETTSMELK